MKILSEAERLAKEKAEKERDEWRWNTLGLTQHNWEPDEDYRKRLEQSFEDYKKKKQSEIQKKPEQT